MKAFKNYMFELVFIIIGIIFLIIGFKAETDIVLFNLDGFYFFMAGILFTIYGVGTAIAKRKEQKKINQETNS
ncbi:MAG: hypothetical protein RR554_11510 [Vagococcus sp.]|uniref:hypothetical protein n=1 Tax=Vagococcus sp. TaxID=1933889 RepID=UPI002FCBFE58